MLFRNASNDRRSMGTRRRLLLEALSSRQLLAADIAFPDSTEDGGSGIVSEFQTPVFVTDPDAISTPGLGALLGDVFAQQRLSTVRQSEAFDGLLYTADRGNENDRMASYVMTNLATGSSTRVDRKSILGDVSNGIIMDVGLFNDGVVFVGNSEYPNSQGGGADVVETWWYPNRNANSWFKPKWKYFCN